MADEWSAFGRCPECGGTVNCNPSYIVVQEGDTVEIGNYRCLSCGAESGKCERAVELATDPGITGTDLRNPVGEPGEGVGVVEAARGTLIHHYKLDQEGIIKKVNLIVATTNNYADICMSIRDAAKGLIKNNNVDDGLLNMVEMAFRAYDPCFGCSTHTLPGQASLTVNIYDDKKRLVETVQRG